MLDRWSKKNGFTGAGDFVKTVVINYWSSFDAEYESIEITISDDDFAKLELQREQHLEKGIITKTDDRYVQAIISYNGKKIKCKLRLKGHMTDHLQDEKWSFRIKTAGGDAFKGMKIFSLMHPGTRNYIYEWIYHQLLKEEGIATVRYQFLNLKVNGSNWGIYALEENFADELIAHNKLPKGPILGFNPDLYWYARLNEHEGKKVDLGDMYSLSTSPEAYDEDDQFSNKESESNYAEAIIKMEKFKRGELSTRQVFDIDKLARFHAILDLVGGQFSLDWSDVKYYYNPIIQKLEPIGYESFSVRNTSQLSGAAKFKNEPSEFAEWHDQLFSDPEFFRIYLIHLKRISKKKYLDLFFDKFDDELKNNLAVLYTEFPYKKLPLTQYYVNQDNIKTLLNTPITTMVYLDKLDGDTLYLTAGNSSVLPIQVSEMEIDEIKFKPNDPVYFSARKKDEHVYFERIAIKIPDSLSKKSLDKIKIYTHYPGLSELTTIKVKPIELNVSMDFNDFINETPNYRDFDFIVSDEKSKEIRFKEGEFVLTQDLIFPRGYTIHADGKLKLSIENNSTIVSFSPIEFNGSEELPIEITTLDSTGNGIILINCNDYSIFNWVNFTRLNENQKKSHTHSSIITSYQSDLEISNCIFSSSAEFGITGYRGNLSINYSQFYKLDNAAIVSNYGTIKCNKIYFNSCKTAIELNGSTGNMDRINVINSETGLRMDNGSSSKSKIWTISNTKTGIYVTDLSDLKLEELKLKNINTGLKAEKKSDVYGPSSIQISKLSKVNVKSVSQKDKNSKVLFK